MISAEAQREPRPGGPGPADAPRLIAETVRLACWRPSLAVLAGMGALVGLTYLVVALTWPRLSGAERDEVRALLDFPQAHGALIGVLLVFGAMFVAAYAGAIGAAATGTAATGTAAAGTAATEVAARSGQERRARVWRFAALVVILLAGLLLAYAFGLLAALLAATVAGRPTDAVLDPVAVAGVPGQLVRGWWALVVLAAIAFAASAWTGRRLAGLAAVGTLLLAEQLASLVTSPGLLWWAPIAIASFLPRADTSGEAVAAFTTSAAYVVAAVAVAVAARGPVGTGPLRSR